MVKNNNEMQTYSNSNKEYEIREETLNGRVYVVVPVTMMVEGVHQGSHGPLLHTASELGKIPESWNGIPVTVGHPVVDGSFVSANSPQVLESWAIGNVFHTTLNGLSLKSEAWLEKSKLALHENLNDRIENGEIIEVSVGVFSEDEMVEGTWHNEQYIAVAKNLRPDHLAILPNETGACSVKDGCGIRVNSKNMKLNEKQLKVFKELKQQGYIVSELTVNQSLLKLVEKIRSFVYQMDNETTWYYVEEIEDNSVIYSKSGRDIETKLYKQGYAITADDSITFVGDPIEVKKKIEYETVLNDNTEIKRTRKVNTLKTEEKQMSNEKCTQCISVKASELIANSATQFTEADRGWLETLEESQLDKMLPKTAPASQSAQITQEMAVNALQSALKDEESWINVMPKSMQEQTRSALKLHADHKKSLVQSIIANTEQGTWTEDELSTYEVEKLEKIAKTAKATQTSQQVNYSGLNAGADLHANATVEVAPMAPAGIQFETK